MPHLASGLEHWGDEKEKKKISVWEEDCRFVRDMEGCLKAFCEEAMERTGGDRLGVSVLEVFGGSTWSESLIASCVEC